MPGIFLLPLSRRIRTSAAAPIDKAAQLVLPSAIASPMAQTLRTGPSASMVKPRSLGNWLIITVSAMPFM